MLSARDRRLLLLATFLQMSTSFLDLAALLLVGFVAAVGVAATTGSGTPEVVERVLAFFSQEDVPAEQLIVWLAIAAAALLVLKTSTSAYLTRRILRFLSRRQAEVSGHLVEALLRMPLVKLQMRSSQETSYALTSGVGMAILVVLGQGVVALSELFLMIVIAVGLVAVDPILTAFAVAFFALVAFIIHRFLSTWVGKLGRESGRLDIDSLETIQEALSTYRELTVSGRREMYAERVQLLRRRAAVVSADTQFTGLLPKYVFEVALVVGAGLLALSQLGNNVTGAVAVIAVYLAAGSRVMPSILRMQGAFLSMRLASGAAAPTYELAESLSWDRMAVHAQDAEPSEQWASPASLPLATCFDACIEVSRLTIRYPSAQIPAVDDVSLFVAEGRSLGLVGASGAGKSTLADAILGVLSPEKGEVTIGGHPPLDVVARWPGSLAYVPQAVVLANSSIMANVALGLKPEEVDENLIWEALERAHLKEFVKASSAGLETRVGERGVLLSGGQRQRLGIARALYTRPRVLVMDEATSALDAEIERAITDTLRELDGDVTTVTIAHRLATIRHCHEIAYLEAGRLVASGSFAEVRQRSERFDAQARLLGMG